MTDSSDTRAAEIQQSIRQILYHDWNPIGVPDLPEDEYDGYIAPVYRILVGSHSEQDLVECLSRMEHDVVGDSCGSPERWQPVAQRLLKLDVRL